MGLLPERAALLAACAFGAAKGDQLDLGHSNVWDGYENVPEQLEEARAAKKEIKDFFDAILEKQKDGQLVEFEMILGQGLLDGGDMWAPVLQRRCS